MLNDSYQSMAANAKLDRKWIEASQRIATLEEQNAELVAALEKLARLGNGNQLGNSEGNCIAQAALSKVKQP